MPSTLRRKVSTPGRRGSSEKTGRPARWFPRLAAVTTQPSGPTSRFPELVFAEPVAAALNARAPIVALETTVITHGLPAREGVPAALELESIVRAAGATPATIGVLEGRVRI